MGRKLEVTQVASFTDAWIETSVRAKRIAPCMSHLLQMRGLKQKILNAYISDEMSHLLQMRGLKLVHSVAFIYDRLSHLLQMRGLKHIYYL